MWATATLLADGKVLIAGGCASLGAMYADTLVTAELYDPATGKFARTGSMNDSYGQATLLLDGRVLMTGEGPSTELYDPGTGKFSPAGSLPKDFKDSAAARLSDGRVLLISTYSSRAELYDPTSGRFVRTGDFPTWLGSADLRMAPLPNGKALVIGDAGSRPVAALYDPATGKFTETSFALQPEAQASAEYDGQGVERRMPEIATPLKDGRVLLYTFGYLTNYGYLETFDPATSAFTPYGFLTPPGQWGESPSATLLGDGEVLFAGGTLYVEPLYSMASNASAGLYDPVTGFHPVGSMPTALWGHTATLLRDGSVLIAGGSTNLGDAVASAELFRP